MVHLLVYSMYLGGGDADQGRSVALESAHSAYVIGGTASSDFPITAGALQTTLAGGFGAFVSKFSFCRQPQSKKGVQKTWLADVLRTIIQEPGPVHRVCES